MKTRYDASDIQVLTGMQAIRKRPGMYVAYKLNPEEKIAIKVKYAGNDLKDPHVLTNLILDAMCLSRAGAHEGIVSEIGIKVNGNEVLVFDNGPGIPMEKPLATSHLTTIEMLLTTLHACRHLKHETIHDFCQAGIVVVNALSSVFSALNTIDDTTYFMSYAKGEVINKPHVVGTAKNKGLAFKFAFDPEIFGELKIDKEDLIAEIEKIRSTTPAKIILELDN